MLKLAIVVIGYNRLKSIKRILYSLDNVDYENDKVDLIISIDNSGMDDVENFSKGFAWKNGKKIVKTFQNRLGLKTHVLTCGDYVKDYDAIAVLEDDIFVSPGFYRYMKETVEFYKDDDNIAGISLYSHKWSEYNGRTFNAENGKYDTYFMQYAQSWGQVWIKNQWLEFKRWYESNNEIIKACDAIPSNVTDWPETSWLKYHITYCIMNNKYFVYPYDSLTTDFTDPGQHCKVETKLYQVPLVREANENYQFPTFGLKDAVYYDAFFERQFIGKYIGINDKDICIDLYSGKNLDEKRYLLTSKELDFKILKSYALDLKPHELNVIFNIEGNDIYLYDTTIKNKNKFYTNQDLVRWYYDSRTYNYRVICKVLIDKVKSKFLKKIGLK